MGQYDITKENLVGDEYRKQYLEHYILSKYREEIKKNKLGMCEFYYSYITFSINALKNQTMSFREILKLRYQKYEKATTRQRQMIHYFFDLASNEFELEAQQIQSANEPKIIDVIKFDESIEESSKEYHACLNQKYEFLQIISRDYINLKQLEKQASSLQKKRQVLLNELIKLFDKNSSSGCLQNICEGFEECLIIEPIFTKKYEHLRKNGFNHKNRIPLYLENSAAVYISLLLDLGKVIKVSKNFRDVVPLIENNAEVIGKDINFMLPTEIAMVHEQILLSSLERKTLNQNLKHYPIIIGKNSEGWSIAYHLKIQLCMIGNTELGACGWIKQINDGNMYNMTSSVKEGFRLFQLDQNFYSIIFKNYLSQQDAKKIKMINIIPMLKTLIDKGQPGQSYETIIIQPLSVKDTLIERDVYDDKLIGQLMKEKIFQMKFSFYPVNNQYIQFIEFQITSLRPLSDQYTKREALRNFKIQIYEYMDINKLKLNYVETFNSMNLIIDPSKELIGTAQNINIPKSKRLSIENFNNEEQGEDQQDNSIHLNYADYNNLTEQSAFKGDIVIEVQQQQQQQQLKKLNSLRQIMETSNENSINGNNPALASRREYKKDSSLDLEEIPVGKIEDIKQKQIQIDSGTIRLTNNTLMQLGGFESQNTLPTPTNLSRKQLGSLNQYDNLNPPTTTDTHNILSSDSLFLSPLSSNRKPLLLPETNRTVQLKGDINFCNNPIIENSFEDENASKYAPKVLVQQKSKNSKNMQPKRKKNVSIQENLEIFTHIEKSELNQSHSHSQNTSKNGDKRTQDGNKGFQDEREKDGSVKTGKTQRSTAKSQMISIIRSKNHSNGLRFINFVGILCIIIICGLNIASFFIQYDDQNKQKLNFENIYWCFQLKRFISLTFGNSGLIKGVAYQFYEFKSPIQMGMFFQQIIGVNQYLFSGYKNLTQQLMQGDTENIHVFNEVNKYQMNLTFPNYMNDLDAPNITSSLTYKLIQFQGYQYYMMNLIDPLGKNELAAGLNYNSMYIALDAIYDNNKDNFFSKIELIIISFITGVFSLLIIPIYIFCMKKKEDILKLFSTIPADKIIYMMATVSKYLEKQEQMEITQLRSKSVQQISNNHLNNYIKNNNNLKFSQNQLQQFSSNQIVLKKPIDNMKKKNISSTNSINKMNSTLIFGLAIFLVMTVFYPASNYIITMSQVDNFSEILKFLNAFDYFIDNMTSMMSIKYGYTFAYNYPDYPKDGIDAYLMVANYYTERSQKLQDNMMKTYQVFEQYDGYNSALYDNYFLPFFKNDICQTIFKSGVDHLRDATITYEQCNTIAGGIFKKGFFVVIKRMFSIFDQFFEAIFSRDRDRFNAMHKNLQQTLMIDEEYNFFQDILLLTKVVHYFFQDVYQSYHQYVFKLQIFLVSLQLVTIFFVMVFGWRKFYIVLGRAFYRSKQLLDLIDVNTILDNPYIVSYFKKNV